ncbi:hypothetical protein [Massilia sp. 9096]|uniref:hypothetical protein n=1 Tax=Massilia sp. 9096 TaxID=1500894 RepID=UPI0012E071CB|nr:hypothetical protein [Massilia sp. 9096]
MRSLLHPIAGLVAELKRYRRNMFPEHTWQYHSDEDRVCSVCDRQEYFDVGGGAAGSEWTLLQRGRERAHFVPRPAVAPPASPPAAPIALTEQPSPLLVD